MAQAGSNNEKNWGLKFSLECPREELEEQRKPPEKVGSEVFQNIFKKAKHGVVYSRSWSLSRVKMEQLHNAGLGIPQKALYFCNGAMLIL